MARNDERRDDSLLQIGGFSKLSTLSVRQLRRYHRLGLLPAAEVDPATGYRYYSPAQATTARVISLLRSIDMPLSAIEELLRQTDARERKRALVEHRRVMERRLDEARTMLDSIDQMLNEEGMKPGPDRCWFCGDEGIRLSEGTTGPGRVCDRCVGLCIEFLDREQLRELWSAPPAAHEQGATHEAATQRRRQWADSTRETIEKLVRDKKIAGDEATQARARVAATLDTPWECCFCGKADGAVRRLVAGPGIWICGECVARADTSAAPAHR